MFPSHDPALDQWFSDKREIEDQQRAVKEQQKALEQEWQGVMNGYQEKKKTLDVSDYEESEEVVRSLFDQTQIGTILEGTENSALTVYAIGKNPARAEELAAIKNPVKFAFAVARMEAKLKVSKKKVGTQPERVVNGDRSTSTSVGNEEDRLRAEGDKTGNYSKLHAYQRQKKKAKRKK